jgi:steroid 5-alpha reductase family enzyme
MFWQAILIILVLNFLGFLYAWFKQSDKGTDLIYNVTFLFSAIIFYVQSEQNILTLALTAMVVLWALRLGAYLFWRIHKMDKDERFDDIRVRISSLLKFWMLQTGSIFIILIPAIIFYAGPSMDWGLNHTIGITIWALGFIIESLADYQKTIFKANPVNKGKFIQSGLWSIVRYPNYSGEIMCWIGVFVFCANIFSGWQWIAVISPIWIATLLIFISGIPLLEASYKTKYASMPSFQKYVKTTSRLIPWIY